MKFVLIFVLCGVVACSFADVAKKDALQTATFKIVGYQDFPPMRETLLEEKIVVSPRVKYFIFYGMQEKRAK